MLHKSFTPFPVLRTERLTLRQLVVSDEQQIFTLRSDSEINKYLGRQPSKTIEEARDFIHKINENVRRNNSLYWAITLDDKDMLVGTICLFSFSEEDNTCEIGYELLTQFQGQGIMKEAVEAVIDYAFHSIQVQKIEAFSHRDNIGSIKLLDKFSFENSNKIDEENPELIGRYLINTKGSFN